MVPPRCFLSVALLIAVSKFLDVELLASSSAQVNRDHPRWLSGQVVEGVGDFTVLAIDGDTSGGFARYVTLDGRRYRAHVRRHRLNEITQTNVPLRGIARGDDLTLEDNAAASAETNAPSYAWTMGAKQILVIRIDFSDVPGTPRGDLDNVSYTAAYVNSLVQSQISPFYQTNSYGRTSIASTASARVYRMPQPASSYVSQAANDQLHADARAAASQDYNLAAYDRIVVLFSRIAMTGSTDTQTIVYGGLADVGGPRVWINGRFNFGYLAHELGHTFGLYHASLWQVSDGNPISPSGENAEYGDSYDCMGHNNGDQRTDFNPWFKNLLGWLPEAQIQTVTATGTYRITRFDNDTGNGILALKIRRDGQRNYWVGCRRKFTDNVSMQNGAYIFWANNEAAQSQLLDVNTPGTNIQDAALALGATLSDQSAGISIQPVAQGGSPPEQYLDVQITIAPQPASAGLANISTRAQVGFGENVTIGGFIIRGSSPKRIVVRGVGPSLTAHVPGALADPVLELYDSLGTLIASNDDWPASDNATEIQASSLAPSSEKEAALLRELLPGAYTAILRGANESTGIGLVEVYDLDASTSVKLANISTRGLVQAGDQVMIGGVIIRPGPAKTFIVRAIGPSLTQAGIQNPLADPTLALHDSNGTLIASNDNWQDDQRLDVLASDLAPGNDAESAVVATVEPGAYTAIVRGKNDTSGIALVEVFDLN